MQGCLAPQTLFKSFDLDKVDKQAFLLYIAAIYVSLLDSTSCIILLRISALPRSYASHTPGSVLVLQLDTTAASMQPIPQLTLPQKIQLLQRHGMVAAAARLQQPTAQLAASAAALIAAQLPAGAVDAADGLQAAMRAADLQARAVALAMQGGVAALPSSLPAGERLVGGAGSASVMLLLPEDLLARGSSKTTTGVEVVLNLPTAGRHLLTAGGAPASTAKLSSSTALVPCEGASACAALLRRRFASVVQQVISLVTRRRIDAKNVSRQPVGDISGSSLGTALAAASRGLQSVLPSNAEPAPQDAVHLRPARPAADSAGNMADNNNSNNNSSSSSRNSSMSGWVLPDMMVWIAYHKAHSGMMGMAKLSCLSGCKCKEAIVDAWISHDNAKSRTVLAKLQVTQHPLCRIGVEVLQQSSTGHHKVKVTGVMISKLVDYAGDADEQQAALIHAIEQAAAAAPDHPIG
jgi:hypothetical protein